MYLIDAPTPGKDATQDDWLVGENSG
jgi:hypothetical protein